MKHRNRIRSLLALILALLTGGTLVMDEFDASIHPMALMNIINIFHPNVLSIGGGVCGEGEYLTRPLIEKVLALTNKKSEEELGTKILTAELGNDAGIIGAAVLGI